MIILWWKPPTGNLNTQAKRLSMLAFDAVGTGVHTLPGPNGSFGKGDLQHFCDCYSGILFQTIGGGTLIVIERAMFRRVFGRVFGRVN